MKNNVLSLYSYQDVAVQRRSRAGCRQLLRQQVCYWVSYIVDTVATIAITCCTVFCCYLALTML